MANKWKRSVQSDAQRDSNGISVPHFHKKTEEFFRLNSTRSALRSLNSFLFPSALLPFIDVSKSISGF